MAHMWSEVSPWELVLSLHYVGSGDGTQAVSLGCKHPVGFAAGPFSLTFATHHDLMYEKWPSPELS